MLELEHERYREVGGGGGKDDEDMSTDQDKAKKKKWQADNREVIKKMGVIARDG